MPIRFPPRREPRVLAVTRYRGHLAWCVADLWELRGSGELTRAPSVRRSMLRRLVRREKPTALYVTTAALKRELGRAARALRIGFVKGPVRPLKARRAAALYPEFVLYAPTPALRAAASLALGALLERDDRTFWTRVGVAYVNKDGSITCKLDALPVSGVLQIREGAERERQDD